MAYVYNSQLDAFTLYHKTQEEESRKVIGPALPALGHAASGAAGTAISKLITYPLDIVITRLQVQKQIPAAETHADYKGIRDAVERIYKEEGGIHAFYNGVLPETLKGVADSFLFFLAYTYIGQKRRTSQGSSRLSALDEIGVGMLAGAFSKFFTSPIQNIVTQKQTAAMVASRDPKSSISPDYSVKDIALQIRDEKGLQGFWSGYSASLILTVNPSITFVFHKLLLRLLIPRDRRSDPGARVTFILAAVSKALASTITYPFSLAKTRAQVSSQKPSERSGPTSETEKLDDAGKTKTSRVRQRTVFSTILRIAQTEGVGALYQGLGAEVLKGFFSHGITMLMKDRLHNAIINLYYLILHSLQKYPSPEELAKMVSDQAKGAYENGKERVGEAYENGKERVGNAYEYGKERIEVAYGQGKHQAAGAIGERKEQVEGAYVKSVEAASTASLKVQEAVSGGSQQAGELLEKGKEAAGNASQQVKEGLLDTEIRDIDAVDKTIKE
ncbi:mitochondrial carrier [Lentithecium fluviatile CBS 122367]|uniref:Mitochondrial carrier n=1 Tax=Lentithecium fluviatile CBS 122367 TaxID=1168545 RepID=A0A6G1IH76_9PLEO|nr:mitochondrial carrier [Lentithecium fluviatile CBS 122367]